MLRKLPNIPGMEGLFPPGRKKIDHSREKEKEIKYGINPPLPPDREHVIKEVGADMPPFQEAIGCT